ncbi:MAG: glycosyl hydrolase [Rubrivivax sp. SCN 71-131]|jgi:photosystem II stability/assembly factor-like uncharacterized protein|nr:MAG: glycosyl hydrolase [Rubrivivax sp. SCN 71-131]
MMACTPVLRRALAAALLACAGSAGWAAQAGTPAASGGALAAVPAVQASNADKTMVLGLARAGQAVVGVGDHGIVLRSEDDGASFRQAQAVPVSSMLTAVSFVDERHGWAVGHWGAILASDDGGGSWRVQRLDTAEDRPLFAVHFLDAQRGVAVGLWSLVLTTGDGGKTWQTRELAPPPGAKRADLNLLALFADGKGVVYAAAERGYVLRSEDAGATWSYLATGYKGSFWGGIALSPDVLLVGGQRGNVYRSSDRGRSWTRVDIGSQSSVTGFARQGEAVLAVGLDGLQAVSRDGGASFTPAQRSDRLSLTAALAARDGSWIAASRAGVLREPLK